MEPTKNKKTSPPRKGATRPPLARIRYFDSLIKQGAFPNRNTIAKKFEIDPATVSNDIRVMVDEYGLPLEWDARRNGYFYSGPVGELPSDQITEGELLALMVAKRALQSYPGLTFTTPLLRMLKKLASQFAKELSIDPTEFESLISFHPGENMVPVDPKVFDAVASGLRQRKEIRFIHRKPGTKQGKVCNVQPVHLSIIDNAWYLFVAGRNGKPEFPKYALGRMSEVALTDRTFPRIEFDPQKVLANCIGVYGSSKVETVELLFGPRVAPYILERPWRTARKKEELPTGEVLLTLEAGDTPELIRWILGWGADVTVLGPVSVRQKVSEHARGIARQYV